MTEERVSDLEDKSIGSIQYKQQEKQWGKKYTEPQKPMGQ